MAGTWLWKNGEVQKFPDGTNHSGGNSVFVSGGDVYVTGYDGTYPNEVAVLWKNGVSQIFTSASGSRDVVVNSVFVVE